MVRQAQGIETEDRGAIDQALKVRSRGGRIEGRDHHPIGAAVRKLGDRACRMVAEHSANQTYVLHEHSGDVDMIERKYRVECGEQVLRIVNRYCSAGTQF